MKINPRLLWIPILSLFISNITWSQQLIINEAASSNILINADEDGDYSDWIELVNTGADTLSLYNFGLTDSRTNPLKWQFPSVNINPSEHFLVFASGKDKKSLYNWQNIINQGDEWKYRVGGSDIPLTWKNINFDDALWDTGKSGFGYADNDDSTIFPNILSVFIRKSFEIPDTSVIKKLVLHMDYDDGFVAFLNGVEIARANLGTKDLQTAYNEKAKTPHEALMYGGGNPEVFMIENYKPAIREGQNVLCIQVHNTDVGSTDMSAIPFLSVGVEGDSQLGKGLPDWFDLAPGRLHTNFAIKSTGEFIGLADSSGKYIDSLEIPALSTDRSFGRYPDVQSEWRIFEKPSPGLDNSDTLAINQCGIPSFSLSGGYYPAAITVSLSSDNASDSIYYTKDGAEPDNQSSLYTSGFSVAKSSVIRARCFAYGKIPGKTITQTYLINENITFPVTSVCTAPANLYDQKIGIFVYWDPYYESNLFQDWERPIHFELFETDKKRVLSLDAGVKVAGGLTRGSPQKSLAVYARQKYGSSLINYQLFPEKNILDFESIVLRNSGNDWSRTMFRDAMMQKIIRGETDLTLSAIRPSVVFLNGEYWGIANIQEKINEHFLAANKNVNSNKLDLLEYKPYVSEIQVLNGSAAGYIDLITYLETHDLSDDVNYNWVASQVDISNFIDYQVSQIYIDNGDWPGNNIKWWRTSDPAGKWRWLLFDTDFGFGLDAFGTGEIQYDNNTLNLALAVNGESWPNPPYSTLLFRSLMNNKTFKQQFVNRYCDLLNSTFLSERVTEIIDEMKNTYLPEINRHYLKWGKQVSKWPVEVQVLTTFAEKRNTYCINNMLTELNLQRYNKITLESDTSMGIIRVNTLLLKSFPWNGTYFPNFPITLSALPKAGYRFVYWSDGDTLRTRNVFLKTSTTLEAIYEYAATDPGSVTINEIKYLSSSDIAAGDWIELYNTSKSSVDISNWILKDDVPLHSYKIPVNTVLAPDDYYVLCSDITSFHDIHPSIINYSGDLGYNFSSLGDAVRLYNAENNLIDEVTYGGVAPWPVTDTTGGFSIELNSPELDNILPSNWHASYLKGGTPGQKNSELANSTPGNFILTQLKQNYPNPFSITTTISYQVNKQAPVEIKIMNLSGQVVKILVNGKHLVGRFDCIWDGTNEAGWKVDGGVYLCVMISGDFYQARKLILLK